MDSRPKVYPTIPPLGWGLIPEPLPHVLPPPVQERSFRSPLGIDKTLYNFALRPEIPITFAAAYVISVFAFNAYNRSKGHEPWRLSKHTWFRYFVIVHNVVLSLYSFATFLAMLRAITHTLPSLHTEDWLPHAADALCKLHGPRGLGDAATFNTTINIWEAKNTIIHLGYDGNPDPTDVGRLWNEGLAFWGWMFYVSKFYEVLDTFIILAKGKRNATLQTYHHAGAMLCMWAGIRYMSPPIWMFVFINSAIHAMMYTYFALSALGYKVPQSIKRVLTSLQIAQFVFGASYAAAHLFVQYDIPTQIPYRVTSFVEHAASSASSAAHAASKSATSAVSAASSFAETPTAAPTMAALIKKLLLRAAGEEGVAERVGMQQRIEDVFYDPLGVVSNQLPKVEGRVEKWYEKRFETRYRSHLTKVNCIDTSGEAFAIYLNLLYLAPLTFLFARFFVRAYTQRSTRRSFSQAARSVSEAAKDASNQTEYTVEKSGEKAEDELYERGSEAKDEANSRLEELRKDIKDLQDGKNKPQRRVSDRVQSYEEKVKGAAENGKESANGRSSSRRSSPSKQAPGNESAVEDEPAPGPAGTDGQAKSTNGEVSAAESEPTQDANIADSQATRPGVDEPEGTHAMGKSGADEPEDNDATGKSGTHESEDTDAMGQSGSIIDLASDKAQEASEEGRSGSGQWEPPGA